LWGETILTATYLYNRTPNSSINFKTPFELKYKETPNISNIKIFGSLTYYKEPSSLIRKLDSKASPYYLIGFSGSSIYKLYNPSNNRTIRARDCKIIEGYYYKPNNISNIQEIFTKLEDLSIDNIDNYSRSSSPISYNNFSEEDIIINNNSDLEDSEDDLLDNNNNNSNRRVISSNNNNNLVELDDDYSEDELAINSTIIIEDNSFNSILNITSSKTN